MYSTLKKIGRGISHLRVLATTYSDGSIVITYVI